MLTLTLSTLGLPLDGVGLLLAIDPIVDMGRTALTLPVKLWFPRLWLAARASWMRSFTTLPVRRAASWLRNSTMSASPVRRSVCTRWRRRHAANLAS